MIRINKKNCDTPIILLTKGVFFKNSHILEYENATVDFALRNKNRKKFTFDSNIYGDDEVKSLLKNVQSHKCCFCEAKITHLSHGDIEHFRPKSAYRQDETSQIQYPGYYWLAYDWNNLYLACEICNRSKKGNYFPIKSPVDRADPITKNIKNEKPLFIDPGFDNPEKHIGFNGPYPIPLSNSDRGKTTIKYLGLDREEIVEHRRTQFNRLKSLEKIILLTKDSKDHHQAREVFMKNLETASQNDAEYSSMVKCNFSY